MRIDGYWYFLTFLVALIWGVTGLVVWASVNILIFIIAFLYIKYGYNTDVDTTKIEIELMEDKKYLHTDEEKQRWENKADIIRAIVAKNDNQETVWKVDEELDKLSDDLIERLAIKLRG